MTLSGEITSFFESIVDQIYVPTTIDRNLCHHPDSSVQSVYYRGAVMKQFVIEAATLPSFQNFTVILDIDVAGFIFVSFCRGARNKP